MSKDFDTWNEKKKSIDKQINIEFYHEREIWWATLGLNIGFEQDGTSQEYARPVLILRGFSKHVCLIVPLTTSQKKNPYHVSVGTIDGKTASAIISQVRLIDTKRLINKLETLEQSLYEQVKSAVRKII